MKATSVITLALLFGSFAAINAKPSHVKSMAQVLAETGIDKAIIENQEDVDTNKNKDSNISRA